MVIFLDRMTLLGLWITWKLRFHMKFFQTKLKLESAIKLVETLCPKRPFYPLADSTYFKREIGSFPFPTPTKQCCAAVSATCRKQQTAQL